MIEGPRAARVEELPDVITLSNRVFYPDGRTLMERVLPSLFCEANVENLRVIVDEGAVVAMAGMVVGGLRVGEVRLRAARIGSVCTLPEHRGRGLAAALMEDAVSHAAARGAPLALISGGRGLYRRMGCINAGLFRVMELERRSPRPGPNGSVRQWEERDLPDLHGLHEKETVRFIRSPAEMAVLVRARAMFCRPCRTWVVESAGRAAAYLCVTGPDDRTGPGVIRAGEVAGSRQAVLAGAAAVLEAEEASRIQIEVPASDDEMRLLAVSRGLPQHITGMHGTLKIIDRSAFLAALQPIFPRGHPALPEAPEELAAAAFGSIERAFPPAAAPPGFPLPLPGYGLSYI